MRRSPHSITCTLKRSAIKKGYSNPSGVIMLPRRTITSDWSWYIVSVIKKEKRVSWLFERGIGYRRYCKERIIKRRASRGTSNTRLFRIGELGPYNPVGRNKLPKKSKRGQKNTRATYYYQSDSIKKIIYSKKKQLRQV